MNTNEDVDFENLINDFDDLQNKIKKINEEASKKLQSHLENVAARIFQKYPIEEFFWVQYTPYFNDGENCVFSVGDVYYILDGDEDPSSYEGSNILDNDDKIYWQNQLKEAQEYEADPKAYVERKKKEYVEKYSEPRNWSYVGGIDKPYYDVRRCQEEIAIIDQFLEFWGDKIDEIKKVTGDFSKAIFRIDDNIMYSAYGDHCKVRIIKKIDPDGSISAYTEVEEYSHD